MKNENILLFLCLAFLPALACAQSTAGDRPTVTITKIRGAVPAETAHIVKYYVEKTKHDSEYDTGNLHIIYSDKTEVIEKVSPKAKSSDKNIIKNQEGIVDPSVAPDKRTIAWTETFDNCGTSYSIPLILAIYQSGKTILHIQQGQMVWYWMFLDGGKRIAAVWGTTHGPEIGDYQLYDSKTGRMLSETFGDVDTQFLKADAPEWAKQTERKMHSR
ncbi:MAG: hypothetical protein P4L53_01675 [Candidatus Obscuribacterales bacterium]|nr:hypothetical protein [Candidatus Obscuribacterales bacterium]